MKCNKIGCNKEADIKVNGLVLCMEHYEEYYQKQDKGCLNFEYI